MLPRLLFAMLAVCAITSPAQDANPAEKLPMVKSGEMPLYPPVLRSAQIEGEVDLRVTTDGSGIASVEVEYGNLLLAKAAQENIKTWKFEPHEPTSFSTVFFYHLEKESATYSCKPDVPDNGSVVLKLPARVDITSHLWIPDCHDANEGLDLSEPLRVFFAKCEFDGAPVSCEKFTIRLQSGSLIVTPTRFKESDKKQGFVVPKEFRSGKNFDLIVEARGARATIREIYPNHLKGDWRIGIDHAPFKEQTPVYRVSELVHCLGFVEILWTEPGLINWRVCD
jgi:hypothetical protein